MKAEREMTLKEWCNRLPDNHLVNKEYKELVSLVKEAVEIAEIQTGLKGIIKIHHVENAYRFIEKAKGVGECESFRIYK